MTPQVHTLFAVVATIVVGAAVAWGFAQVGSPMTKRLERLDERRLADLRTIAGEIQALVADPEKKGHLKQPLPPTLDELAQRVRGSRLSISDPETGNPYRYTVKDQSTFELCATFARPRNSGTGLFWNHPAGEHCFTINVLDPTWEQFAPAGGHGIDF